VAKNQGEPWWPLFSLPMRAAGVKSFSMTDYDKAGRYLVKCDPQGHFRWLLSSPRLTFHAWIDSRRVALPKQNDLTNDLVGAVRNGEALEAICLELEAEARADTVPRVLGYVVRLWTEPGGRGSLPVSCVGGAILDLTGRSPARGLSLCSAIAPQCRLELSVLRCHLADEDARTLVAGVAAAEISPWLLAWVPLMQGGGEPGIIGTWRSEAERLLTSERDRADLGSLALVFATLAGCRPAWERGLRGWNMKTSPIFDEIRAESLEQGREEGREQGRTEEARAILIRLGQRKFGKAPTKRQQRAVGAITDLAQLESLAERLVHADSWAELLDES